MLISLLLLCSSCDSYRARRMEKHAIAFPDSLEFIYQGEAGVRHLDVTSPPAYKLVMVIDSVQCSFCKVQKLQRYRDLFKESIDGGKFDLLVILSPKRGEADDLREFLLAHDFSIPIFLDQDNTFLTLNPFIPSDAVIRLVGPPVLAAVVLVVHLLGVVVIQVIPAGLRDVEPHEPQR